MLADAMSGADLAHAGIKLQGDVMTRSFTTFVLAAALAACGAKSAPNTTPSEPASSGTPITADEGMPKEMPEPAEPAAPEPAKPDPKAELLATEMSAWEGAKPAFMQYCASCHSKAGKKATKKKLDHFALDTYPPSGHHTATIGATIRDVLGLSGKQPTMPYDKPGSVKGDELAAMAAWAEAWEAADKGGAHPAAADHHH
jgi:hypothetical protein